MRVRRILEQNRQKVGRGGFQAAVFAGFARGQHGLGVFEDLFGDLEELVVEERIVVFADLRTVVTADLRTVLVDTTAVVCLQVPAVGEDLQVPRPFVNEDYDAAVDHVPVDVFEVLPFGRSFDWQCEVAAAVSGAMLAENFAFRQIFAS